MSRLLKHELRQLGQELAYILGFIWGFFVLCVAAVLIIVAVAADGTYAELGSFVCAMLSVMLLLVRFGLWGQTRLAMRISMGQTRRATIVVICLRAAACVAACAGSILCFTAIESNLYAALYPTFSNEIAMHDILPPAALLIFAGLLWLLLIVLSAIVTRFGPSGWIGIWGIWLFACLVLPRLSLHDSPPGPVFDGLARALGSISAALAAIGPVGWIALGVIAVAALLFAAYRMFMRAELRF